MTTPPPNSKPEDMRPESPRSSLSLVLPPPLSTSPRSSNTTGVSGPMTLPPLATMSPLLRPSSSSGGGSGGGGLSLSNLIHQSEPAPPQRIRGDRRREASPPPRPRPRLSAGGGDSREGYDYEYEHQPRRVPVPHPQPHQGPVAGPSRPAAPYYHQPAPAPAPWPPRSTATDQHRRTSSISHPEVWFAPGDIPARQQYDWSRDRVEGYRAGWEDALRSVEAGVIGVAGQQYARPLLVRQDLPPMTSAPVPHPHPRVPPPPLRQSSSSDPGPSMYYPGAPRSLSFSSIHPSHSGAQGPAPGLYQYSRPSTAHPQQQRHSYSSTTTTASMSPTESNDRRQRQAISCYPCRGRKLKCDGERPCSQCVRRGGGGDCEYAAAVRRRGKGRKGKSEDGDEGEGEGSSEDGPD